jgi:hypothetical protein
MRVLLAVLMGLILLLPVRSAEGQCVHEALPATTRSASKQHDSSVRPGARLAIPHEGTINAFVIFVQFPDEPDGAGNWGDDPKTEWPHPRSLGPERRLPAWADDDKLVAAPGTDPAAFGAGSLSAFYHLMSKGRFQVTGHVYPEVIHPEHPVDWYHAHRGDFLNGAVALSHEILTSDALQQYFATNPDGLDLRAFDRFRNGTPTMTPDGVFDLVVLVHRDVVLPRLRLDRYERTTSGSSMTSFGADTELRPSHLIDFRDPSTDAFAPDPVTLGDLRVIDNVTSGSGITARALTRKQAVRIITHEIGHRHFGLFHTCQHATSPNSDCVGIMGGAYVTMSAGDRIKLGWAEVDRLDMDVFERRKITVPDALRSGRVLRVRAGGEDRCGDLIVEARFWTNFWDHPPNPDAPDAPFYRNDDGDQADLFLPQEGLYLYKAPAPGEVLCGGSPDPQYDYQFYSSLENNDLTGRVRPYSEGPATEQRAFRVGGTYQVAYEPGHTYAPHDRPRFHGHPNPRLDPRLTLTNIERTDGAFTAELWTDFLAGPPEHTAVTASAYPNPFASRTRIRYEVTDTGPVQMAIYDARGRRVATLADGPHQAGIHEVPFAAGRLPSGLYWVHLRTGGRTATTALHLVR